jgi:UPF0716 protein FxsA
VKLRSGWPLLIFVVLLVAVPILEVWLLIAVSRQIGGWPLIAVLVVEVFLGAWLMRREGSRAWTALNAAFSTGRVPTGELADAALILVGGVLLMLPGFTTDLLGLAFLLPMTRPLARRVLAFFVARRINKLGGVAVRPPGGPFASMPGTVIPGETVDAPEPSSQTPPGETRTQPVVISGEVTDGPASSTGRPSS